MLDACSRLTEGAAIPDTGTLAGDLLVLLRGLAAALASPGWSTVLPSIIDAAERDPETAKVHLALHTAMIAAFDAVTQRAATRGDLPSGRTAAAVVAATTGALFYRRWFSREAINEPFIVSLVQMVSG